MRGQHGGERPLATPAQLRHQLRVGGQRVQRIGVEDQPTGEAQQPGQPIAHRIAAPAAADDGGIVQYRRIGLRPVATHHQLRVQPIDADIIRRGVLEAFDEHPSGSCRLRRTRCKQSRAGHADRTADHGHIAEAAFVLRMQAR